MIQQKRIFIKSKNSLSKKIIFAVLGIIFFSIIFIFFSYDLPDLNKLEITISNTNIIVESYDNEIIATYNIKQDSLINIDNMPLHTIYAIISAIDPAFYTHHGINIIANLSKVFSKIIYKTRVEKRSTITQQVAKKLFSFPSKSIKRRIQEYILSLKLEKKFTKKQILSMYLNRAYFGAGLYGLNKAAERFFRKKTEQLTLYESVKLAAILAKKKSKNHNNININENIKNILFIMKDAKYITEDELNDALFLQEKTNNINTIEQNFDPNKYFSDWVIDQVENLIIIKDQNDIFVKTTLDLKLQKKAILTAKKIISENGLKNRANQIALISIDKIGAIRAMIGGVSPDNTFVNRVFIPKPIGSLFDFFTYLVAIESGMNIYDSIKITPIVINSFLYKKPESFESIEEISLINAFINSIDVCSIRLAKKIGISLIKKKTAIFGMPYLQMKGITGSLGIDEVSLMEITTSYSTIMNDGNKINPFGIICIQNESGQELYRAHKQDTKKIISQNVYKKMKALLRESILNINQANIPEIECYGKIGFSNDNRNAYFIGFSIPLITGVWIGNDNNNPMINDISAKILPAIVWKEFMQDAFNINKPGIKVEAKNNISNMKPRKRIRDLIKFTFS